MRATAISNRSSSLLRTGDPIAASITPPGRSSIAGIRVSGREVVDRLQILLGKELPDHTLVIGALEGIDTVTAVAYHAPRSYTGEDVVELFCHGNPLVVRLILSRLYSAGFRPAEPGEFSIRAVLHGKMDLLQAEGVAMVIDAGEESTLAQASRTLEGKFSHEIRALREMVVDLLGEVQAVIEFPEDDLPLNRQSLIRTMEVVLQKAQNLLASSRNLNAKPGITITIAGPPNVGKSTLFNALLGWERAIVHTEPGTTRDHLEENLEIRGVPVTLQDTAGVREALDTVEGEGVRRTKNLLEGSDAVLFVVDSTVWTPETEALWESLLPSKKLLIWNKVDLSAPPESVAGISLAASALQRIGIEAVQEKISSWIEDLVETWSQYTYALNQRQKQALETFVARLNDAIEGVDSNRGEEEIAFLIQEGVDPLSALLGEITPDEVFQRVFSTFCIGK
ncbi:MAG TPA: tRNA uridine-5-carboxymethylaminomethyl(34) synthesis GTPase MnmE [Thermoanaerobaculia bacterium]|nr:tRNA uridine-5-carboxymethylaminomethyl(34) synthesis GTPase MnmE [Thermoanaerobaculia bacterium]HUM29167.1 tRNA uridine-5-carboxymethylaminomethyl(34) synthesis GTPase MnmE [Thermoanaerobaculia bacterium]HXK67545.1 tRNA uridine-5-carboxymethylaminomethyl(34) synthesis GTPase MnmE [Thermoanaerobaculia bacterium]